MHGRRLVAVVEYNAHGSELVHAHADLVEDDGGSSVDGGQVILVEYRIERIGAQRLVEESGEALGAQEAQTLERRVAHHAALTQRRQYGHLVLEGSTERAAVVQVEEERVVAERDHALVVVSVHVAREEVEHGRVDQRARVEVDVLKYGVDTILVVLLPLGLGALVVRAPVRIDAHVPLDNRLGRQDELNGALQVVLGLATRGVRRVAIVRTMARKASISTFTCSFNCMFNIIN